MMVRGIVDQFTAVRGQPRVHASGTFKVGMRVKICRVLRRASSPLGLTLPSIITICRGLHIKEILRDGRGRPTNQVLFMEYLPDEVEAGDLLIWEGKQ
jgi:hypothetical protein